jgi:hypothetical protein
MIGFRAPVIVLTVHWLSEDFFQKTFISVCVGQGVQYVSSVMCSLEKAVRMVLPEQFFYKDIKGQVSNTQYQNTSTKIC